MDQHPDQDSTVVDGGEVGAVVQPVLRRIVETGSAPGMAFGVLAGDRLVLTGAAGERVTGGPPPDADTVFRIASMTKSVTAATVLGLRDDGLLSLDQPACELVPELAAGGAWARQITLRHLLGMGAGLATDDPWGDRQQSLPHDGLRRLLASGVAPVLAPGTRFEYSNLGYALLGLAVEGVTGHRYDEVAQARVLTPVGMVASGFHPDRVDAGRRAIGYVKRTEGWVEEPSAVYGAFAPMGGLFSTVTDLARWVSLLLQAADADVDAPDGALRASSLREMQTTQRLVAAVSPPDGPAPEVTGYGFGLFEEFRSWGRTVHHSGGYPGFGSHMRWHPASGLAVIVLANGTYAPALYPAAREALQALVLSGAYAVHREPPDLPSLTEAGSLVARWLSAAEPEGSEAHRLRVRFADNVEADLPWRERLVQWAQLREALGPAHTEVEGSRRRPSAASLQWDVTGLGRRARVVVMMAPHDVGLVQSLTTRLLGEGGTGAADGPPADTATDWS